MTRRELIRRMAASMIFVGGATGTLFSQAQSETIVRHPLPGRPWLYSWASNVRLPYIYAMFTADYRKGVPVLRAEAMARWARTEVESRCIRLAPLAREIGPAFNLDLRSLVVNGPSGANLHRWWNEFLWMLQRNDLTPHRVAIDIEHGFTYWHRKDLVSDTDRRSRGILSVYADPQAFALLPEDLKAIDPNDIALRAGPRSRAAIIRWNAFAAARVRDWVHSTFVAPLWEQFPRVRVSNYQDAVWNTEVLDDNGWPRMGEMAGNDASPSLYSKDPARNLEQVDSILPALRYPPVPWIACPSIMTWDSFEATLRGCVERGCSEFLFFNPEAHRHPDEQRRASELAEQLRVPETTEPRTLDDLTRGSQ